MMETARRDQLLDRLWKRSGASSAHDWVALEEFLLHDPKAEEYAEALADFWQSEGEEPGFLQPAGSLVSLVNDLLGEPVEF